ncbi:hypothetical protein ABTZ78_17385 [Streptomyces bauhiniae]|uniref:hypothetical protein n=1 Tax=Streptomyces bauhiniae TaxID=2340725 RepID=UPI0033283FC2
MSGPKLNRRQRRDQQREIIRHLLDGPRRVQQCGQAKAAARTRAKAGSGKRPPKNDPAVKAAAHALQEATGQPYHVCLAEARAEQARTAAADEGAS